MQLGMVGRGRMGANPVHRPAHCGHGCVVTDVHAGAAIRLVWTAVVEIDQQIGGHDQKPEGGA